jgi:hypothetical protein
MITKETELLWLIFRRDLVSFVFGRTLINHGFIDTIKAVVFKACG